MVTDINSVLIIGRLTRDSEAKYSASGTAIVRFSIANTQSRKDGDQWVEESHFFDAVMLGRRADALQRYLLKGKQVALQGTLQQNRWQDKQTSQNRSRVEIFVNDIQLIGGSSRNDQRNDQRAHQQTNANTGNGSTAAPESPESFDSSFDDDIPF